MACLSSSASGSSKKTIIKRHTPHTVLTGHSSDINSCDFANNDVLLTGSSDQHVSIWFNPIGANCKPKTIHCHKYSVNHVQVSPQGTMFATASSDGTTSLWDLKTTTKLCTFVQPSRLGVRVVRFSPDASLLLTAGDDECCHLWDISSRNLVRTFSGFDSTVFAADFTPDAGSHVVVTDANGTIQLWNATDASTSKYCCLVEEAHDLGVNTCHVSPSHLPDPLLATGGTDNLVKVWRINLSSTTKSIKLLRTFSDHDSAVMCVRFSPDGSLLASTGGDKYLCVYSIESLQRLHKFAHHTSYVGSCAFNRSSSLLATGSNDRTVAIWVLLNHSAGEGDPTDHNQSIDTSRRTPVKEEDSVKDELSYLTMVSEADEVSLVTSFQSAHASDINGVEFVAGDALVTAGFDRTIKVWERTSDRSYSLSRTLAKSAKYSYSATHGNSFVFAVASLGGYVSVFCAKTLRVIVQDFKVCSNAIRNCHLLSSSNGQTHHILISGDGDSASVWRVVSERDSPSSELERVGYDMKHDATVFMSCFASAQGNIIATGCNDGYLKLWSFSESGSKMTHCIQEVHDLGITCGDCDYSSSDCFSILITGGNDSIMKAWKISTKSDMKIELIQTLKGHGCSIMSVRFAPTKALFSDGCVSTFASTSGDKTVRIWNAATFNCLRVIENHQRYVICCAFSHNACLIASGSNDKSFNVWSIDGLFESRRRHSMDQEHVSDNFVCPITQDIMRNPVKCSDGFIYERAAIQEWIVSRRQTSPMTNLPLENLALVPQPELQMKIRDCVKKSSSR